MRSKGLVTLLAVTVVAVILAVLAVRGGGTARNDPLAGTAVLPEVAKRLNDVGRVALARGDVKTTLVRQGDQWTVEEKGLYPADEIKIHQVLLGLAELTLVEPKTRKPDLYARLDLDDADKKGTKSTLVTVTDAKGSLLGEVIAGKRKVDQLGGGNDGIYVRKPGDAQSWLARGTLDVSGDTAQWLDKKIVDLPAAKVKLVAMTAADGAKLTIQREKPEDKLALVEPPLPAGRTLKTGALDDTAGALAGLELTDVRPAKDFDFPKDGVATARYETFDGMVLTIALASKDGADWVRIGVTGAGDGAKAATDLDAKLSPWIFAIGSYKAKTLRSKLDDLMEPAKAS